MDTRQYRDIYGSWLKVQAMSLLHDGKRRAELIRVGRTDRSKFNGGKNNDLMYSSN